MVGMEDKSVIILTSERCGCSWLSAVISEVHRQMYGGVPIYWDYEISRIIAVDPKYNLPKTHASVYYLRPEWLLQKDYDKIIVLQRDLESLKIAICRYYLPQLTIDEIIEEFPEFIEQLEFYYELMYGEKVLDERILYVQLSDLNNYPVVEFSRVLDFLEYPFPSLENLHTIFDWCENYNPLLCEAKECGYCQSFKPKQQRPILLPIKIYERDWDLQGTIINKGHSIGESVWRMIKGSGVRGMMLIEDPDVWKHPECSPDGYIKSDTQYVNFEKPNPYKISPEEWRWQEARVFRVMPGGMPDILETLGILGNGLNALIPNIQEVWSYEL